MDSGIDLSSLSFHHRGSNKLAFPTPPAPLAHDDVEYEAVAWSDGRPRGKEMSIGESGVRGYFAIPRGWKKGGTHAAVVIVTDAFGWKLKTFRIIADTIARNAGVMVVIPDLLEGGLYLTSPQLIDPPESNPAS
ncbi:hypothetical protein HK101_000436, partial [Irineochytrium annulatum]